MVVCSGGGGEAGTLLFVAAIRATHAACRRREEAGGCDHFSLAPCGCVSVYLFTFMHKSFKCVFQACLAQRLCNAERGSVSQLSLYTSPSLPNITLGLPATATATAASNVRHSLRIFVHPVRIGVTALSLCPWFPGDFSPAGGGDAAGALPQPAFPHRWTLALLPGGWSGDRPRSPQSSAPTHGVDGAEPSAEPPGDRC